MDQPPVASLTASCSRGKCSFDASSSTDDRGIASYAWSYGDGTAASAGSALVRVPHTYTTVGKYTVTLTVVDGAGQRSTASAMVNIRKL